VIFLFNRNKYLQPSFTTGVFYGVHKIVDKNKRPGFFRIVKKIILHKLQSINQTINLNKMRKNTKSIFKVRLLVLALAIIIAGGFTSCKSQKKIAAEQAAAERAAQIEQAKQDLLMVINDQGNMSLQEKEDKLSEVKGMNLEDPEVDALIIKAEEVIAAQKAKIMQMEEEKRRKELEAQNAEEQKFSKIENLFNDIANSKSMEMGNTKINEALRFFASPDVPVLIITFMEGSTKDYDRPTTIKKYLEYIKDQHKNANNIHNVQFDASGKITELELIKK